MPMNGAMVMVRRVAPTPDPSPDGGSAPLSIRSGEGR